MAQPILDHTLVYGAASRTFVRPLTGHGVMDRLTRIYGLKAYRAWMQSLASRRPLDDVSRYQEADEQAGRWVISSYPERVRAASFLSIMNKRLRWFNQHTRYEKDGEIVRFVGG